MECNMGDHRLRRIDFPSSFRYTKHKQNAPGENLFLMPRKSMIYNDDNILSINNVLTNVILLDEKILPYL